MCNLSIILFILIIIIIDYYIYWDTNNLVEYRHNITKNQK